MTTTNIGPCNCCTGCCANPPATLTVTISATGDCSCWEGSVTLNYSTAGDGQRWEASTGTCGFTGGIILECVEANWAIVFNYQSNQPNFGSGCIFGTVQANSLSGVSCSPFYAEISAGILSFLGGNCCGGTVTLIITE
jgi:hypothetical protein